MGDIECEDTIVGESDILQIAFLELVRNDGGYWIPGKHFNKLIHTGKKPKTQFAKEHLHELFEKCREAPQQTVEEVRQEILAYFRSCGAGSPYVYLTGWNITMLDIPMLTHYGYLKPFYRQTINGVDVAHGDFHYRVDEIAGRISQMMDILNMRDRNELIELADHNCPFPIVLPEGTAHDALYDCYKQTRVMNGLIRLGKK